MCSNFSKKPRSPGEFTPRPGSQYCFFRAFHLLWDMQVQLKHMVNQNSPHRLQGGSKDVAQVCGETPRRHRAVRMTTEQQQAGAEWVQRWRSLGPKVGTSLLPLLPRSLVQQLPLAEHELTVLICCLWKSLWGRHRVLLKSQQKWKNILC